MDGSFLDKALASPRIPTLPQVAVRVVELTERADVSLQEIAETIQHDQALNAKLLRLVNSSYFGLSKRCVSLNQAMVSLGVNAVKSLALSFSLVSAVGANEQDGFDYVDYWRRGLRSAVGARAVASRAGGVDADAVYLAGILQDLGMIVLLQAVGAPYRDLVRACRGDHRNLQDVERRAFGVSHADVGAALLERWHFSPLHTECVRYHEHPADAPAVHAHAVRCLALANLAADLLNADDRSNAMDAFIAAGAESLGLSPDDARATLLEIVERSSDLAGLLRVNIGERINPDELLHTASERIAELAMAQQVETIRLNERNAKLERVAWVDSLTGVANRGRFDELLAAAFDRAQRTDGCLGLVFVDADRFKNINDTKGHLAGDAALIAIAERLVASFEPSGGAVCRYGGEEFAVLLEGFDRVACAKLAETFRASLADSGVLVNADQPDAESFDVTVSVGVAAYEPKTAHAFPHAEQLVRAADQAVYAAKGSGRNCVRVFNPRPKEIAA